MINNLLFWRCLIRVKRGEVSGAGDDDDSVLTEWLAG
jgi:hypothetical protein